MSPLVMLHPAVACQLAVSVVWSQYAPFGNFFSEVGVARVYVGLDSVEGVLDCMPGIAPCDAPLVLF